jgi:hypothetical protein
MRGRVIGAALVTLLFAAALPAQPEGESAAFRRGNERAALSRWNEALEEYGRLAGQGVRAPALYWNWAQAASASGKRGEALWALLRAQDLAPHDSSITREMERTRAELGLDPSELSRGFLGDASTLARRFRFDLAAVAVLLFSLGSALRKRPRAALAGSLLGFALLAPIFMQPWREPRGVVVRKDAPLVDVPRADAVALANLREGEVVPLLEEEGEYVKIQDASGARGFARKEDVRRIGINP